MLTTASFAVFRHSLPDNQSYTWLCITRNLFMTCSIFTRAIKGLCHNFWNFFKSHRRNRSHIGCYWACQEFRPITGELTYQSCDRNSFGFNLLGISNPTLKNTKRHPPPQEKINQKQTNKKQKQKKKNKIKTKTKTPPPQKTKQIKTYTTRFIASVMWECSN